MLRKLRFVVGRIICRRRGVHALGVAKVVVEGYLFQVTCPCCGAFALLTQTDIEQGIIGALTKEGRYTDIRRVA